ncbi:hypothetical protein E2C01_068878 [Portunus trituberculatus]|uniref:Uncharacterized protein n=1 Tax=Portunus trituberculatus TaxID=210409 RepID=A0A5B7I0Q3_PORTR|nr:hypothetical protein [Portunus trituberculatus]
MEVSLNIQSLDLQTLPGIEKTAALQADQSQARTRSTKGRVGEAEAVIGRLTRINSTFMLSMLATCG